MKRLLLTVLCALALCSAQADTFSIDSAPYNDGTEYISPYNSTFNGEAIQSWCIELNHTVNFGQQFQVTAVNLANFMPGSNEQSILLEVGFLMQASLGHTNDLNGLSLINRAIWFLTTPGADTNPYLNGADVHLWVDYAQGHPVQPTDFAQFTVFIRDNDIGQAQMAFTAGIPEPSTYAYLGIGLISLLGFKLRRRA